MRNDLHASLTEPMITINIDSSPDYEFQVDRDNHRKEHGRQGLNIPLGAQAVVHFEDEADAERLARAILLRLGVAVFK